MTTDPLTQSSGWADEHAAEAGDPRQRVLDAAEALFMERGYNAIALRDIANALGIKQASLYYHFPHGKEEMYVAVAERAFARHFAGMSAALDHHNSIEAKLNGVAAWFGSQPRMCLMGMVHADLPALHPEHTDSVTQAAFLGLFRPLADAFAEAQARGEIGAGNTQMLAGAFLALLDGLSIGATMRNAPSRPQMASDLIALFLNGARPRTDEPSLA
jgi:AcrR family transcriptional regulator